MAALYDLIKLSEDTKTRHHVDEYTQSVDSKYCDDCGKRWPCDTWNLADAIQKAL